MLLNMLTTLVLMGASVLSVDEAFEILKKPQRVTEAKLYEAKRTIEQGCPDGDETCIRRLIEIWEGPKDWGGSSAMLLACKKADDKTLPIILDAVREAMKHQDDEVIARRASDFFSSPAIALCERLTDVEPVLRFALETGHPFHAYPCPSALKDRYLLQEIRRKSQEDQGGGSYAWTLSENAIAPLRELMREMVKTNSRSDGAWIAIDTLAELSDTEIIPDLEAMLAHPPFEPPAWRGYENRLQMYLAKLRFQGQPNEKAELMRIVRTEREWLRLLHYAVWRLLYLKMDRQSIVEALESNKGTSSTGRDVTTGLIATLIPGRVPDTPERKLARGSLEYEVKPLIFDGDERKAYLRDLEAVGARNRELDAEADTIRQAARLAPDFDYEEQRENPDKWKREHPDEARRLAEIAEAKKALWHDTMGKYTLGAILSRAPRTASSGD